MEGDFIMGKKFEEWVIRIAEAESSDTTIRQWCKENGISKGSYYYWHKILKNEGLLPGQTEQTAEDEGTLSSSPVLTKSVPDFAELPLPINRSPVSDPQTGFVFNSQIMLQLRGCQVFIGDGFSSETLTRVMEVVS